MIMIKKDSKTRTIIIFAVALFLIFICFESSRLKTRAYNKAVHSDTFSGSTLFDSDPEVGDVSVSAVARSSTWGKIFDFDNQGLTENNYQAYTYDFSVSNNTKDAVSTFSFVLRFSHEAFLSSAWNGSIEVHQFIDGKEVVDTVPDLREFNPSRHNLDVVTVDGENLIRMKAGDFFVYTPSTSVNALEVPIRAHEGTTPGFIMYVKMGESIYDSTLTIDYKYHRRMRSEPLFWVSAAGLVLWVLSLINVAITSARIRKFNKRHERDNEIINESIETFTGFIDAKDPYTNGHSKRVAKYTRLIAQEMGFEGEDLDRIYYTALLHDCGKIGVPDNILGKPGKLTDEEFKIIKSHTVRGGEILKSFKSLEHVEDGARYHHERYDGHGYPEGKEGENIPLIARMICVADSFDAMSSNRVYRNHLTKEQVIEELEKNKGKQFDPQIADIMLRLIKEGKINLDD